MEKHIESLLRRVSYMFLTLGSLTLILLYSQPPSHCLTKSMTPKFPHTSCEANHRRIIKPIPSLEKQHQHLLNRTRKSHLLSYALFFRQSLLNLGFLSPTSRVLCVSASSGLPVHALSVLGLTDVTAVELIDTPPLVLRSDPHNLPFFDSSFDLSFSPSFHLALFPSRYASEMQRTVRTGGFCVVLVPPCHHIDDTRRVASLFRGSSFVGAWNVTLLGEHMTQIVLRVGYAPTPLPLLHQRRAG